jgi:hypothetical protein
MFNFFKKSTTNEVSVIEPPQKEIEIVFKEKSVNEIIEEIHETFFTEVDKLLESAMIAKSLDTDKQSLIDKCARLKKLGFENTKEIKEAEIEIERLNSIKLENDEKQELFDAINYFSFKYPNYKFITKDSVEKICEKYKLFYGDIKIYTGDVPDENLKHIEDFKIDKNDECYVEKMRIGRTRTNIDSDYHNFKTYNEIKDYVDVKICPLEIVAPLKDFETDKTETIIRKYGISHIEIPDPIVLKPVFFDHKKYYLIVTAWGLEAGDELVVNERHN